MPLRVPGNCRASAPEARFDSIRSLAHEICSSRGCTRPILVVGVFRSKGVDKGKTYVNRERFVDTGVKINGTWKCVASVTVLIPSKQAAD